MRHFNITGLCTPSHDYMVDISAKIKQIRAMVDTGEYFTINRARQYGKTTTLQALKIHLKEDYIVSRISFEGAGGTFFLMNPNFVLDLTNYLRKASIFHQQVKKISLIGRDTRKSLPTF